MRKRLDPPTDQPSDPPGATRTPGGVGDAVLAVLEGPERTRIIEQLAARYRVPDEVVDEWCQEAYVALLERFSVPGRVAPGNPVGYAYTVVRNLANRSWGRAAGAREELVDIWDPSEEIHLARTSRQMDEPGAQHDGDPVRLELELAAQTSGWEPWLLSATLSLVTLSSADGPLSGLPRPRAELGKVFGWQALHLAGRGELVGDDDSDAVRQARSRAIRRVFSEVRAAYGRAVERGEVAPGA